METVETQTKEKVAIIDHGAGNLRSVADAVAKLGYEPMITGNPSEVLGACAAILPGVGAAGDTMRNLRRSGMAGVIDRLICEERSLLAVCVGMQVLFSATEEGGWNKCLEVIPGTVKRLPEGLKIPHMGWNQVKQRLVHPLFDGIPDEANFYFVHSYYAYPNDTSVIAGTTEYGETMCSVLIKGNLVATQFHPEKSGEYGLRMYGNFLGMALGRGA